MKKLLGRVWILLFINLCLPYGWFHTSVVWSVLIEPWSVSSDSPVGLGWCESSFECWCRPNNRTLVRLKTWVSVRLCTRVRVHFRWEPKYRKWTKKLCIAVHQIHYLLWPHLVRRLCRTTHHNPFLSSGPAFSFDTVSLVSFADWNVQQLTVLSAAHIVHFLVKHLTVGNTKSKPENPIKHKFGVAPLFLRSGSVDEFHSDILSNRQATVSTVWHLFTMLGVLDKV